jgi:hypothetical protein
MTYNHSSAIGYWGTNEDRTLRMEQAVFEQIRQDWATTARDKDGNVITFGDIRTTMQDWNAIQEGEDMNSLPAKRKALNDKLTGFFGKPMTIPEYDRSIAQGCRFDALRNQHLITAAGTEVSSDATDYPGTIFDTPTEAAACTMPTQ